MSGPPEGWSAGQSGLVSWLVLLPLPRFAVGCRIAYLFNVTIGPPALVLPLATIEVCSDAVANDSIIH